MNPRFPVSFRVISLATMLLLAQSAPPFACGRAAAQDESQAQSQSEAQSMPEPTLSDPESLIEVSIPSVAGQVQWSDVATEVGDQLKLDPDALRQMLPSGTLDIGSPSVMLTLFAINLAASDAVSFSIGRDDVGGQVLKVRCRRSFFTGNATQPANSIAKSSTVVDLDSDWAHRSTGKPLLVFVHGMNSGPDSFDVMRAEIRKHEFATASVGYDFRQSIADSARTAMVSLKSAMGSDRQPPDLCLIGHSMGGLVSRQMTESSLAIPFSLDPKLIKQLITIGTPHQGSNWASLPPLSDMFTADGMDANDMMDVLLHRPSSRGIQDLIPGSPLLKSLNSRDRRDDVSYTAIIGTASPVNESQVNSLRQTLQAMDQQGSVLRLIRPRIRPLLESFDELTAGKGDGIVSVESARLPGIKDNVEIPVTHFEMIRSKNLVRPSAVLEVLLDRLNQFSFSRSSLGLPVVDEATSP